MIVFFMCVRMYYSVLVHDLCSSSAMAVNLAISITHRQYVFSKNIPLCAPQCVYW